MAQIEWTEQAYQDIDGIAEFIARDSRSFAVIQTQRFFERTKILESNPLSGRIVPELNREIIRELVMANYRIIYRVNSKEHLAILTIHHSKRSLSRHPTLKLE